jgi:hypothetical protein
MSKRGPKSYPIYPAADQGGPNFLISSCCAQQAVSRRHAQNAKRPGVSRVIFSKFLESAAEVARVWKCSCCERTRAESEQLSTAHKLMHRIHTGKKNFKKSSKKDQKFSGIIDALKKFLQKRRIDSKTAHKIRLTSEIKNGGILRFFEIRIAEESIRDSNRVFFDSRQNRKNFFLNG